MEHRRLFLDSGVLLNLCVVETAAEILAALPYRTQTTSAISEMVYTSDSSGETKSYSSEALVAMGRVSVIDIRDPSVSERFIELACLGLRGTLGELAALASASEGDMATDDQVTIGLMTSFASEVPLLTTSALIHEYAEVTNASRARIIRILTEIQERALFIPSEGDPFRDWWLSHLQES